MGRVSLKFETEALNLATRVKEVHDIDCVVCPCLRVKGGKREIVVHCNHPALSVPIRIRKQFGGIPKWCPRRKAMLMGMKIKSWK